jgi:monoamine oxidase
MLHAMEKFDVIVVGGGFSGVTAAVELSKTRRVLLLEASSRLGGRARSLRVDYCSSRVDVGAHYFGKAHRRVVELVRELGLWDQVIDYVPSFGSDPIAVCDFASKRVVTHVSDTYFNVQGLDARAPWAEQAKFLTGLLLVEMLCKAIDGKHPERSLFARKLDAITYAELVDKLELPSWFSDLMRAGVEGVWSQKSERMSLLYFLWYLKNNGGFSQIFNDLSGGPQQYGLRCGLEGLLDAYAKSFRGEMLMDKPVRAIRVVEDGALVETQDGAKYFAQDVVIAVTPRAASQIHYEPELPAARRLLHEQQGGHAIKAVMFYERPWWHASAETGGQMFAFLSRPGAPGIDWILACSPSDGAYHALTVFVMPELVDRHDGEGPEAVRRAIADAVVDLVRDPRARDYWKMELCDWRKEPWMRGGPNTTFGLNVLTQTASVFNRPDFGRLYFASSEYATSFTGYIEGAIAAGRLVAEQVRRRHYVEPEGKGIGWPWLALGLAVLPACVATVQALRVFDGARAMARRALFGRRSGVTGVEPVVPVEPVATATRLNGTGPTSSRNVASA